jgi:hypothetical protein
MNCNKHRCVALESVFVDESWMDSVEVGGLCCGLRWSAMKSVFIDESWMCRVEVGGLE